MPGCEFVREFPICIQHLAIRNFFAGVAELVDAQDLKSCEEQSSCGFKSRPRHAPTFKLSRSLCERRSPAALLRDPALGPPASPFMDRAKLNAV